MSELARRKYLERYAEPEARLARQLGHQYSSIVVVPVHGEVPSFLDELEPALKAASGRALLIVVVNATDAASEQVHHANAQVLSALAQRLVARQDLAEVEGCPAQAALGRPSVYDILVIDRASPGRRLPAGEGVGLARRIGTDVGLAHFDAGGVVSPWFGATDADARLPVDYFARLAALGQQPLAADGTRRVGASLPFWHYPSGEAAVDDATAVYELSLRYYTLGLASAGSPYAYESMGSSLAVLADAYADVRGFPRRQAGEDFYLLDKLAKVGSIHRPSGAPILLRSRMSDRVPFGTGSRVRDIVDAGGKLLFYHPRTFELLGLTLRALRRGVVMQSEEGVVSELRRNLDVGTVGAISTALEELQAFEALRETFGASSDPRVRERRLLTWFDALRTLRFVHLIEAPAALPRLPWESAFELAPFTSFWREQAAQQGGAGGVEVPTNEPGAPLAGEPGAPPSSETASLEAGRMAASEAEQTLPLDIGVGNVISGSVKTV